MSPSKDAILVIIVIILLFGAKKLPELSRAIGQSVKEFRGGIGEGSTDKQELPSAPAQQTTTPPVNQDAQVVSSDTTNQAGSQQQ